MNFEWDPRKNASNVAKHGVSFEDAKAAFDDPRAVVAFDPDHSTQKELRWWLLGKVREKVMLVRYTQRPHGIIASSVRDTGGSGRISMKDKSEKSDAPKFDAEGYQVDMRDLNGEALPDLSKLEFRPFAHGGARKGAGRKPSGRKPVLLRLSPSVIQRLRAKAKATHKTISEVAEEKLAVE